MIQMDPNALYMAIDQKRRANRMSWSRVAAEAQVGTSTLNRIGQFKCCDSSAFVRLMLWLGTTDITPFIHDRQGSRRGR